MLPLETYLLSLPWLHPFWGGWVTDLLVAAVLPLIGVFVFGWGLFIKSHFGIRPDGSEVDEDEQGEDVIPAN